MARSGLRPVDLVADREPDHRPAADAVGPALLALLDQLAPAERVNVVLHDPFKAPFDDIAPDGGRSPVTARRPASRARWERRGQPERGQGIRRPDGAGA